MEDQHAVTLLTRHSRGVELTSACIDLYDRAIHILDLLDHAPQALIADAPERLLRLGAMPFIVRLIGAGTLNGGAGVLEE